MHQRGLTVRAIAIGMAACGPSASAPADGSVATGDDGGPAVDADIDRPDGAFESCAEATVTAEQKPAAMLVVLDRSASMAQNNKYAFAAQAIVQALDQDVFDAVEVGLYVAPTGSVAGPSCILNLPVACQAPPFPQIDLATAGNDKSSSAAGVRRDIRDWLAGNAPDSGIGDASPLYSALQSAIATLQSWPQDGNRILFVVTDGSISCNEFSNRPGYGDCNGCARDWESPQNIIDLLAAANNSVDQPIQSFVVGVPGADTYDPTACDYPPYRMRHALSAIAAAGAPDYVPTSCDGTSYDQNAPDPTVSCHFDMTQGNFSIQSIADAMTKVRGEVAGCIFDLPEAPDGQAIDPDEVNVEYSVDGATDSLARRGDPADDCDPTGCWDYTDDGRVELIGAACEAVKGGASVEVRIVVGCQTVVL
jgi:hypothetical protein